MSERAKTVGNNKGSPRSELVVSQQNTAANNIKRSRISKKADSVSSLSGKTFQDENCTNFYINLFVCKFLKIHLTLSIIIMIGINKKWNQIENTGMSVNSSDNIKFSLLSMKRGGLCCQSSQKHDLNIFFKL